MTMVETLVACFLLGLACTLMMSFFIYSLRQTQRNLVRQELIRGGEKVVEQVLDAYGPSDATYVQANTSISGILIPQASAVNSSRLVFDSNGDLTWTSWRAFGYDSTKLQVWQAWQAFVTPVNSGGELSTGPTVTLPAKWSRRVVSPNVSLFNVTGPTNGVLRVRVVLKDSRGYQVEVASSGVALN